jgi:uncharacterized protein (TIGR03382 family)
MGDTMNRIALLVVIASIAFIADGYAEECRSGIPIESYSFVASPQDTNPPAQVEVTSAEVIRGSDTSRTLCKSIGSIGFFITPPVDNQTPGDYLGYVVNYRSGSIAEQAFREELGESNPMRAQDGVVWVNFYDRPKEDLIAEFTLVAMDEAGNIGQESSPVQVEAEGIGTGCSSSGSGSGALGAVALIAVWIVRRKAKA